MLSSLDLHAILPLCLEPGNDLECIGVRCNSSTSNCELLKKSPMAPTNCVVNPVPMEEKVFLKSELVKQQPELALIALETGKIVSASYEEIPPIAISAIASTVLQAQWGKDILTCSETSTECHYWSKDTNQWRTFPALNLIHWEGSMSVIGDTPIVIAGKGNVDDHGIVEIFNRTTQQWSLGPPIMPVRRAHTTVVLNDTALMVIGGFNTVHLSSVKILNIDEMAWHDMNDLLISRYGMLCGLVNLTYVLCIGGEAPGHIVSTAYGLDMALSNPEWERKPSFDLEIPALGGFIYELKNHLYCMIHSTSSYISSMTLRRMSLDQATLAWEDVELFPISETRSVTPYVLNGFQIKP